MSEKASNDVPDVLGAENDDYLEVLFGDLFEHSKFKQKVNEEGKIDSLHILSVLYHSSEQVWVFLVVHKQVLSLQVGPLEEIHEMW